MFIFFLRVIENMKLVSLTAHIIFVDYWFSNKNTHELWTFKHFFHEIEKRILRGFF